MANPKFDYGIDMQVMVANAFQQAYDSMALEVKTLDVVEEDFRVTNEL